MNSHTYAPLITLAIAVASTPHHAYSELEIRTDEPPSRIGVTAEGSTAVNVSVS
jgi:hypothetical protein